MLKSVLIALAAAGIVGYACGAAFGGDEIIHPPPAYTHTVEVPGPATTTEVPAQIPDACKQASRLAEEMYQDVQEVDQPYKMIPALLHDVSEAWVYQDVVALKDAQSRWNELRNQMIPGLNHLAEDRFEFRKAMDECTS